jgi:hypothetical protein
MKKTHDYVHEFFGLWSPGWTCRVRIYEPAEAAEALPVLLLSTDPHARNSSVTNSIEQIAAEVLVAHPGILYTPHHPLFLTIEHHPRTEQDGRLRGGLEESFLSVTFAAYDVVRREHSGAMAALGIDPPQRLKLGPARWVNISREEAVMILGEEP